MRKFINIIKNKWLVNTSKTILLIIIIFAIFIGINYAVQKLDLNTIDLTQNKIYSLTDQSKEKVKDIKKQVNIYFFGFEEDNPYTNLAKQYSKINPNIKVKITNPSYDTELYTKYEVNSDDQGIVVACGQKSKILSSSDFSTYDYSTNTQIDTSEETFTSTILNLIADEKPGVYFLTGHSEKLSKLSIFQIYLTNEVNEVNSLDLITSELPENCDCLVLTTPSSDYSQLEADKIKSYINNGGNILCLMDSFPKDFVNLQSILDLYGVSISDEKIRETDTSKSIPNDGRFIIPDISYHEITQHIITDGAIMFIDSSKLNLVDDAKLEQLNVTANNLIESSKSSYLSTTNENGPFTLGTQLTKTISPDSENSKISKLIIYANSNFAGDLITIANQNVTPFTIYSNKDLLLNTISYLAGKDSSITIRKNTNSVTYTATKQQNTIILLIIFIIPLLIILAGIIVGFIRRRK